MDLENITQQNTVVQGQRSGILHHLNVSTNQVYQLNNSGTGVPAANNYQLVNDMSDSGKYVLSVNKGQGRRKFDREFRANFVN